MPGEVGLDVTPESAAMTKSTDVDASAVDREGAEAPLQTVAELANALEKGGLRYCHWKSNTQIGRSESGQNDLDLLVRPDDLVAFTRVLRAQGFVPTRRPATEIPGIESFYGYDRGAARFVHAHIHDRLVLGHDRTKNVRLPIEEAFLSSSRPRQTLLPIPEPEFEYVVLVIRMVVKYCIPDELAWNGLRGRRTRPKKSERAELADLGSRVDRERVATIVDEHVGVVGLPLFEQCEAALAGGTVRSRLRTGRRLEKALQPWSYRDRRLDLLLRVGRRIALAFTRRRPGAPARNRVDGRGAIVALIGGDGSGKTTALDGLERWLGACFDVRRHHMGKPPWSATTFLARAVTKATGLGASALRIVPPVGRRARATVDRYRPLVWFACTARDRARLFAKMDRERSEGVIVLCDRFPHPNLRLMDVPQIRRIFCDQPVGRLGRRLIRIEESYHDRIGDPDRLIVLRLDPVTAAIRKTTESAHSVVTRGREVWDADWTSTTAHVIDARKSPDAVLEEARGVVWAELS